jgi:hypothetical protein
MVAKSIFTMLFVLVVLFLLGIYYFSPYNGVELSIEPRNYNFSLNDDTGMQFYNNMRFPTTNITYLIDDGCSLKKSQDMRDAFDIIESLTPLNFIASKLNQQISITCNETSKYKKGMFIAGEGGPSKIVRSGEYNVILAGTILLIKDSNCERPNVAMHELLHVLGFEHSSNPNNIMYNFTKCSQVIGDDTVDLIKELYSEPPLPNLMFEDVSADINKRYLNLNASIRNAGLAKTPTSSKLLININNKTVKEMDVQEMVIGNGITITLSNLFIKTLSFEEIELVLDNDFEEMKKQDNFLVLGIEK